jgi:hypothetical protein
VASKWLQSALVRTLLKHDDWVYVRVVDKNGQVDEQVVSKAELTAEDQAQLDAWIQGVGI